MKHLPFWTVIHTVCPYGPVYIYIFLLSVYIYLGVSVRPELTAKYIKNSIIKSIKNSLEYFEHFESSI